MTIDRPNQEYLDTLTERCRQYIADLEAIVAKLSERENTVPRGTEDEGESEHED